MRAAFLVTASGLLVVGLAACGGAELRPGVDAAADAPGEESGAQNDGGHHQDADAGTPVAIDAPADSSTLVACANQCAASAGGVAGECPVLLTYDCLKGPCGNNASSDICAANGAPPSASTVRCVQAAFPHCPSGTCQNSSSCSAFIACIEGCR